MSIIRKIPQERIKITKRSFTSEFFFKYFRDNSELSVETTEHLPLWYLSPQEWWSWFQVQRSSRRCSYTGSGSQTPSHCWWWGWRGPLLPELEVYSAPPCSAPSGCLSPSPTRSPSTPKPVGSKAAELQGFKHTIKTSLKKQKCSENIFFFI